LKDPDNHCDEHESASQPAKQRQPCAEAKRAGEDQFRTKVEDKVGDDHDGPEQDEQRPEESTAHEIIRKYGVMNQKALLFSSSYTEIPRLIFFATIFAPQG